MRQLESESLKFDAKNSLNSYSVSVRKHINPSLEAVLFIVLMRLQTVN